MAQLLDACKVGRIALYLDNLGWLPLKSRVRSRYSDDPFSLHRPLTRNRICALTGERSQFQWNRLALTIDDSLGGCRNGGLSRIRACVSANYQNCVLRLRFRICGRVADLNEKSTGDQRGARR